MSEKYSTEELVKSVQYWKTLLIPAKRDAIIARLRAADKLCEAAKTSADEWWRITHEAAKFGKPIVPANYDLFISNQVKAIADYEGKHD